MGLFHLMIEPTAPLTSPLFPGYWLHFCRCRYYPSTQFGFLADRHSDTTPHVTFLAVGKQHGRFTFVLSCCSLCLLINFSPHCTFTAWRRSLFFWHIKPYNRDIYDHIWCSTALLWRCSHKSWSSLLKSPLAENNRGLGAFQVLWQFVENDCFKRQDDRQMFSGVLSCSDTKTWGRTTSFNLETAVSAA